MNSRDWDFAIGSLGDPLADIEDWMMPPYPTCLPEWQRRGHLSEERSTDVQDQESGK